MSRARTPRTILGISADYHDAAAALVVDGEIVAAASEERFTRVKHDPSLPRLATSWCLEAAGLEADELDVAVFYSKPLSTYERVLATHAQAGPRGARSLATAVTTWSTSKLWIGYRLEVLLRSLGHHRTSIAFAEHHESHAAAAFYPSPFDEAAILTVDGVGEWATTSIAVGEGSTIRMMEQINFPDSLGLFYSAMTAYCGFDVNDGEYKLMGLAPYGEARFADALRAEVVHLSADGELRIDQRWFDYQAGRRMTRPRLSTLLDGPARRRGEPLEQRHADIAASTQAVLEDAYLAIARRVHRQTGSSRLCLAGGVALNCVANARLRVEGPFDEIWIQPAAGDDGSALGAALWAWHNVRGAARPVRHGRDAMRGAALGPAFSIDEVEEWLEENDVDHERPSTLGELCELVASELASGSLVGWFDGAMEFGPRSLGHRSILADPRSATVAARLNAAVKGREDFRPFAPAVLAEHAAAWFELDHASPYMLETAQVHPSQLRPPATAEPMELGERLAVVRSEIPACTHVDGSARVQTVDAESEPRFHALIEAFRSLTGTPVLLNTSFNRSGEPIVCTPADAHRTFVATGLDLLVLEGCVIRRARIGVDR